MSTQIDKIKKDMEITRKRVDFWLNFVFYILLFILVLGIITFFFSYKIIGLSFCCVAVVLFLLALSGFMIVPPEERIMIEFLGKAYCIKKPGLRWVLPILTKKRMSVLVWRQRVELFPERAYPNGIHIDFKNGGKAELVDPILWIQLRGAGTEEENDSVLRSVYSVDNWKKVIQEMGEDNLRTCLNNLTVEDALSITHDRERDSWWNAILDQYPHSDELVKSYGFEVTGLTISDFNWDASVVAMRQKVFEEERSIELARLSVKAAENEVLQKAMESGGQHGEMVKILREQYGYTKKDATKVATELVTYFKGADTGRLVDVRSSGGESGLVSLIANVFAILNSAKQQFPSPSSAEAKTESPKQPNQEGPKS